jgi:hypothetical protein
MFCPQCGADLGAGRIFALSVGRAQILLRDRKRLGDSMSTTNPDLLSDGREAFYRGEFSERSRSSAESVRTTRNGTARRLNQPSR